MPLTSTSFGSAGGGGGRPRPLADVQVSAEDPDRASGVLSYGYYPLPAGTQDARAKALARALEAQLVYASLWREADLAPPGPVLPQRGAVLLRIAELGADPRERHAQRDAVPALAGNRQSAPHGGDGLSPRTSDRHKQQ